MRGLRSRRELLVDRLLCDPGNFIDYHLVSAEFIERLRAQPSQLLDDLGFVTFDLEQLLTVWTGGGFVDYSRGAVIPMRVPLWVPADPTSRFSTSPASSDKCVIIPKDSSGRAPPFDIVLACPKPISGDARGTRGTTRLREYIFAGDSFAAQLVFPPSAPTGTVEIEDLMHKLHIVVGPSQEPSCAPRPT